MGIVALGRLLPAGVWTCVYLSVPEPYEEGGVPAARAKAVQARKRLGCAGYLSL